LIDALRVYFAGCSGHDRAVAYGFASLLQAFRPQTNCRPPFLNRHLLQREARERKPLDTNRQRRNANRPREVRDLEDRNDQ
jgi:ribosomal protein S9